MVALVAVFVSLAVVGDGVVFVLVVIVGLWSCPLGVDWRFSAIVGEMLGTTATLVFPWLDAMMIPTVATETRNMKSKSLSISGHIVAHFSAFARGVLLLAKIAVFLLACAWKVWYI